MPGLVPGIYVLRTAKGKTWMAGTSPAMTWGGFALAYAAFAFPFWIARQTRSGVSGISISVMP
jgi:hypothetical protein